jgi:hypothetical protein
MAWPLLFLFIDGLGIIPGGIMAERVDNEYPPEATIGDQRLRKDRGKIAEAVSFHQFLRLSTNPFHDGSITTFAEKKFHHDKLVD